MPKGDSAELLVEDIMRAGDGLSYEQNEASEQEQWKCRMPEACRSRLTAFVSTVHTCDLPRVGAVLMVNGCDI